MVVLRHTVCPATTIPVSEDGPSRGVAPISGGSRGIAPVPSLPFIHPGLPFLGWATRAAALAPRKDGHPLLTDRPGPCRGPGTGKEGLRKDITLQ
jgi:hypothetical protein